MVKKLIVGCSSSSGSTLLSDLLDSTPHSACGQELEIFSNRRLLSGSKDLLVDDSIGALKKRTRIRKNRLHGYGVNENELTKKFKKQSLFLDFINWFARYYLSFRGKKKPWLFSEKTPVNIYNIERILGLDDKTYFLFMVRDPLYACTSMIKRGFSRYKACGTWLLSIACYHAFRNHPRIRVIRYEDLIKKPYNMVRDLLLDLLKVSVDLEIIEENYKKNLYRKFRSQRISSWSINKYGKIRNANNRKIEDEDFKIFKLFLNARVNKKYAEHFGMSTIGFRDAMELFAYSEPETNSDISNRSISIKNLGDTRKLVNKYFLDFLKRDASVNDLMSYMNPIVFD